ncbi:MAG TPA: nitroreductase family protein [Acidimicrobiales bacterium]|nr:nitroreductase family protein [Acidimicrobiales bacterium]
MEFADVVRRRRMVRRFDPSRPVPRELLVRVLDVARRAPSAGWSQGTELLVLEGADAAPLWEAPVVVVPLSHKQAYLDRYSLPDKAEAGMDREEAWPVPYWDVDAAFAAMLLLLAAVDEGLGALFFGLFRGKESVVAAAGVPAAYRPIGGVALGYPAPGERSRPSWTGGRRPFDDVVHFTRWRGAAR